jgi:hypothetical protein
MIETEDREFVVLKTGGKYYRDLGGEGALVSWTGAGVEIVVNYASPAKREVDGFANGEVEFGLNVIDDIPWVCFRVMGLINERGFGKKEYKPVLPWQDCPFHAAMIDPPYLLQIEERASEYEADQNLRLITHLMLLNFPSNTILTIRFFTLSPFFSRKLLAAVLDTKAAHNPRSYNDTVPRVYNRYPVNYIGQSSRIRCKSGD